jgi:hypothetical protein
MEAIHYAKTLVTPARLHDITTHKSAIDIFIVVRTSSNVWSFGHIHNTCVCICFTVIAQHDSNNCFYFSGTDVNTRPHEWSSTSIDYSGSLSTPISNARSG